MNMEPTGWGGITILSGVLIIALFIWQPRPKGTKNLLRLMKIFVLTLLIPCFLFSFMQWASWYK